MLISGFLYNIIYYWLRWLYRYWYIYTAIYCDILCTVYLIGIVSFVYSAIFFLVLPLSVSDCPTPMTPAAAAVLSVTITVSPSFLLLQITTHHTISIAPIERA